MRTATLAAAAALVVAAFVSLGFAFHSFTSDPGLPTSIVLGPSRTVVHPGQGATLTGSAIGAGPHVRLLLASNTNPRARAYRPVGPLAVAPGNRFTTTVRPPATIWFKVVASRDHAIASRPVLIEVR